jgi:stage II sporulation protein D
MHRLARAVLATVLTVTGLAGAVGVGMAAPAAAATCPSPGGVGVPEASASGEVVFRGHGWGHGLGMSQYGAEGAAKLGCSYAQILSTYYNTSVLRTLTMPAKIHLRMLNDGGRTDVTAETGNVSWQVVDSAGAHTVVTQLKGSTYRLYRDDTRTRLRIVNVATGQQVWISPGTAPVLRLAHAGTVVHLVTFVWSATADAYVKSLDRRLRWDYTQFSYDGSWFDAVQVIENNTFGTGMQKYLWGIAEVPTLFPTEALKAQSVAARTYAARLGGGSLTSPLMPTPADQNYTGYAKESEDATYDFRWKNAVNATNNVVLRDGSGGWVTTYYSSSMGGHTEDVRYVGWSDSAIPYLTGVDDSRWEMASGNSPANRSWAKAFTRASVAAKLGFTQLISISVPARGTAARLDGVDVRGVRNGSIVSVHISGWDVRQALGLLSPNFVVTMSTADQPITGDWDGDGDDDPGWFRNGDFALRLSDSATTRFTYGTAGDVAVAGDWDGDGDDDIGVFRKGAWYLRNGLSAGPTSIRFDYGQAGDRPVVGRWNGTTLGAGVARGNQWYLRHTLAGGTTQVRFTYGLASDRPVAGDWDADGDTTVGMVRGNTWYLRKALASGGSQSFGYGLKTDRPVAGDWNHDGRSTIGIVRSGTFYLRDENSGGSATQTVAFAG